MIHNFRQRHRLQSLNMKEDAFASQQTLSIKSTSTSRSTGIMRHVSNLLLGNKKSSQKLSDSSPTSSVFKMPRSLTSRPSKSSLVSTSYSPSVDYGKSSSNSYPNILPSDLPSLSTRRVAPRETVKRIAVVGPLPQDIVNMIVSHTPRRSLPSIARCSRAFCKAARAALYSNIDVRFIRSARFEQLCILLASHTDLANLVERFTYHTWHPSFFQRTGKNVSRARDTRISLSSSATATLARALKNMRNLQHLTLPSFNASLMQDVLSPVLKKLTLFNHSLSPEEQHELKLWLRTQPGLQSLSLPNLFEKQSNVDSTLSQTSPGPSAPATPEISPPSTPPLVSFSGNPSSLRSQRLHTLSPTLTSPSILSTISEQSGSFLPLLHSIHAPPNLVTFILGDQTALPTPPPSSHSLSVDIPRGACSQSSHTIPLKHTTLRIHSTLYTGLRPSSVMQSLASRGTSVLTLCFSNDMDKRTVEKVLGAAGSMLGQIQTKRKRRAALEILEVEVGNAGVWCDDDVLNRIISSIIPRFRSLRTLRLRYTPSRSRPPVSFSPSAANSTDSLPLSIRSMNTTTSRPTINSGFPSEYTLDDDEYPTSVPTDAENSFISAWVKSCPTLSSVFLLSGAEWKAGQSF